VRVLFATYAEKTHFLSMVPLAWALRSSGHDVRVASQPELVDVITDAGLPAVPVGTDHNLWVAVRRLLNERFARFDPEGYAAMRMGRTPPFDLPSDPGRITPDYLRAADEDMAAMARMINSSMVDDLVTFARQWRPELVIWEPTTYCAAIAARAVGATHVRFLWGPDHYGAVRSSFLRARLDCDALGGWIGERAHRHGVSFSEDLVTGQATLDQLPPPLRRRGELTYLPLRYVPYGGRAVVPDWLRDRPGRRRVALTLGLSATERFDGYVIPVPEILRALGDVDVEVVATIAESEQASLGELPDNVRVVAFTPLHALLSTCDAVIHHGGAGTVATTTLLGIPQLVIPDQGDGEHAARRLAEHGAGLMVQPGAADGATVRDGVSALLDDPAFAARTKDLREDVLRLPPPNEVADRLVQIAGAAGAGQRTRRTDAEAC
jgi:glycosyltransferase (activator-dependent family)